MIAEPAIVSLEQWVNSRLPDGHPLRERFGIVYQGRVILVFGTQAEALAAAKRHGWTCDPWLLQAPAS